MDVRRAMPLVLSDDLEASRALYVGTLGFEVAMDEEGFLMLRSPSVATTQLLVIARTGPCKDPAARAVQFSVEVDDVEAAHTAALAQGLEVVRALRTEPWGVRRFFLRDASGVVLNVAQHAPQR